MYQFLFRNRWLALVWVLSMLGLVATFFAKDGGQQKLEAAAKQIGEARALEARVAASEPAPAPVATEMAEEESLIDQTTGFDPDPEASSAPAKPAATPRPADQEEQPL